MPRLVGYGPTDDADGEKNRADGGDRGYARKSIQARKVCHDGRTDQKVQRYGSRDKRDGPSRSLDHHLQVDR